MATIRWEGQSQAVAQVDTGSVDTFDAATTYSVTINGVVVSVTGDTDVPTTATNLVAALTAETHPYFSTITWANPSSGTITATANVAGFPFSATLSAAGGTGTVTNFSNTTANAGPLVWDDPDNWVGGALPGASDDVVVENFGGDIWFGLDGITAALGVVEFLKTFTGKVGLNSIAFATDVSSEDTSAPEYRTDYLEISADEIHVGQQTGPGTPSGTQRAKIDNTKAGSSVFTCHATAPSSSELGFPAIRYKANNAGADVIVLSAQGGIGIGKEFESETALIGDIDMRSTAAADKVFVGDGVTFSNFIQAGGTNIISAAATVTSVRATGGALTTTGDFTITTLTNDGAEIFANHKKTAGNAITTANNNSGTLDGTGSGESRTWSTVVQSAAATLVVDPLVLTISTLTLPTADRFELTTQDPQS